MKEDLPILSALSEMGGLQSQLQKIFPRGRFSIPKSRILVAGADSTLLSRFVEAVSRAFSEYMGQWIEIHPPLVVPQAIDLSLEFETVFFVFRADHFDTRLEEFLLWSERPAHRERLLRANLYAFRIFPGELVRKWQEPIEGVPDETIVGVPVSVTSIALEGIPVAISLDGNSSPMLAPIARIFMSLAIRSSKFSNVAQAWDDVASAELGQEIRESASWNRSHSGTDAFLRALAGLQALHKRSLLGKDLIATALTRGAQLDADYERLPSSAVTRQMALDALINCRLDVPEDRNGPSVEFARDYQLLRSRLLVLMSKISRELDENGYEVQAEAIRAAEAEVSESLCAIMLGAFSSGKSSFLNALLHLGKDALLVGGGPETATINFLEYGEKASTAVAWLAEVNLEILSPAILSFDDQEERWSIQTEVIKALLSWLASGEVDTRRAEVEFFDSGKANEYRFTSGRFDKSIEKKLRRLLDSPNRTMTAGELARDRMPYRFQGLRFTSPLRLPTDGDKVRAWLKKPEVALRVHHVSFRFNLEVLRGLSFVDTPGTGSIIGFHHKRSYEFVGENPASPILYCFDGSTVCKTGDRQNIRFLQGIGGIRERVFFIITKRQICQADRQDEDEIRRKVRAFLNAGGYSRHKTYFIDSQLALEGVEQPEWLDLIHDLRTFVERHRTDILRENAEARLKPPLQQLKLAAEDSIRRIKSSDQQRQAEIQALEKRLHTLRQIKIRFSAAAEQQRQRLLGFKSGSFETTIRNVIVSVSLAETGALVDATRDARIEHFKSIVSELEPWPDLIRTRLQQASDFLHSFLKQELTDARISASEVKPLKLPANLSLLNYWEVMSTAREKVTEREAMWDGFFPKYSYKRGLERKKRELLGQLEKLETKVPKKTNEVFSQQILPHYQTILDSQIAATGVQVYAPKKEEKYLDALESWQNCLEMTERQLRDLEAVLRTALSR